jgi:hypothetical protein
VIIPTSFRFNTKNSRFNFRNLSLAKCAALFLLCFPSHAVRKAVSLSYNTHVCRAGLQRPGLSSQPRTLRSMAVPGNPYMLLPPLHFNTPYPTIHNYDSHFVPTSWRPSVFSELLLSAWELLSVWMTGWPTSLLTALLTNSQRYLLSDCWTVNNSESANNVVRDKNGTVMHLLSVFVYQLLPLL